MIPQDIGRVAGPDQQYFQAVTDVENLKLFVSLPKAAG